MICSVASSYRVTRALCIVGNFLKGSVRVARIDNLFNVIFFSVFVIIRDDLGGMGLDGMNLVEAMAEAMDDLRIDNRGRQDPALDQRENPPENRGGGAVGRDADDESETFENFFDDDDELSDTDGSSFSEKTAESADSHEDAASGFGGESVARQEGEARAMLEDAMAMPEIRGRLRRNNAVLLRAAGEGARKRRAEVEEVDEGRDSDSGSETTLLDAFMDLEYRPPTPPRRSNVAGRGGLTPRPSDAAAAAALDIGVESGIASGAFSADVGAASGLSPHRRGYRASGDWSDTEGESLSVTGQGRPPSPIERRGRYTGVPRRFSDRDLTTGAGSGGNAEPRGGERDGTSVVEGGDRGGEIVDEMRPRARTWDPIPPVRDTENRHPDGGGGGVEGAAAAAVEEMAAADEAEDNEDDMDDGFFDGDLDVHMAVDELLGIRGPLSMLLRNVLWVLVFHGAYLGLFAFFPFSIGARLVWTSIMLLMRYRITKQPEDKNQIEVILNCVYLSKLPVLSQQ